MQIRTDSVYLKKGAPANNLSRAREVQGRLRYTEFSDLTGHRVGVTSGYSYTPEFWDFLKGNSNYTQAK